MGARLQLCRSQAIEGHSIAMEKAQYVEALMEC